MYWTSPHWKDGVCTLHKLPSTPCPACLANVQSNPDLQLVVSVTELATAQMTGEPLSLPADYDPTTHGPYIVR